ncbi:MAG: LD-carboxypeptidase [Bacteroidia bacterium]|nr:LD-carboxypeptidase [Bacteroidia bacterium]
MQSFIPRQLRQGDLIGIVSPASPPHDVARIARGIRYVLSRGFRVCLGSGVGLKTGYLAGPDCTRRMDLESMFADEQVRAILCTRGGYGAARLLDGLDWDIPRRYPKIFAGFSDITALNMALFAKSGLMSFAGPMVAADFADEVSPIAEAAFWSMMMEVQSQRKLELGGAVRTMRAGKAEGPLLGGNLSVFCSLIGTPYLPSCKGAILFFEDTGEAVYRIDRMMLQLRHSGVLAAAAGILLGSFTAIPETVNNRLLEDVLEEYILPLNIPTLTGIPFGHIRDKITLPMGAWVAMDASNGAVVVTHPVVR